MSKLKILFHQVCMISAGILFIIGINGTVVHLKGKNFELLWYYPFSILLVAFLSALPTYLLILKEWGKQKRFLLNLILHCLSVWTIVAAAGWVFKWYCTWKQLLILAIEYIVIYIFVWVVSWWSFLAEDKKINRALADIQDEE